MVTWPEGQPQAGRSVHFTDEALSSLELIQSADIPAQPEGNPSLSESKVCTALPPLPRLERERSGPSCVHSARGLAEGVGVLTELRHPG